MRNGTSVEDFDPDKIRIRREVQLTNGTRKVWDKRRKKFASPEELPAARNPKFTTLRWPVEEVGRLAVLARAPEFALLLRITELWFSSYQRNPVKSKGCAAFRAKPPEAGWNSSNR